MEIVIRDRYVHRDGEWIDVAREAMKLSQVRRQIEQQEEEMLRRLKELSQGRSSRGGGFVYVVSERKGSIDYKIIPELKSVDLDRYRKASASVWRLSMELQ